MHFTAGSGEKICRDWLIFLEGKRKLIVFLMGTPPRCCPCIVMTATNSCGTSSTFFSLDRSLQRLNENFLACAAVLIVNNSKSPYATFHGRWAFVEELNKQIMKWGYLPVKMTCFQNHLLKNDTQIIITRTFCVEYCLGINCCYMLAQWGIF